MNYSMTLTGGMNARRAPSTTGAIIKVLPAGTTGPHSAYGSLAVGSTPNLSLVYISTTLIIACTSSSANRLFAGATYFI